MPSTSESTTRRRFLGGIGSTLLVGSAGCTTGSSDETPTGTSMENPTQTPRSTPTGTPTETSTETKVRTTTDTQSPSPSPTPTETPTGTATTWKEGGPPDRKGWTVTFQDDFSGDGLDWDTWEIGFGPYNDHHCAAAACARRENVSVDTDTERLVLKTTEGAEDVPNSTWLADYKTGAVTTGTSFSQTFGYFEAKAKMPSQPGALPAFWAWSKDGNPPEIDFYESFGATPSRLTTTIHVDCGNDDSLEGRGTRVSTENRIDETFHAVGCRWGPKDVTWYVNGREVHHVEGRWIEECHDPEPLFPILNTHVGGREGDFIGPDAVGDPTKARYPYTHEVEWVRVWQHEDWA